MEIPSAKWEKQRKLSLDVGFREAVAEYLRRRWPHHTAKCAARAFDWTHDRAREAVAGRVSLTSLEQMFKAGGFGVALPIIAAVIGHSIAAHFANEKKAVAHERAHTQAEEARVTALEDHARRRWAAGPAALQDGRAAGEPGVAATRMGRRPPR